MGSGWGLLEAWLDPGLNAYTVRITQRKILYYKDLFQNPYQVCQAYLKAKEAEALAEFKGPVRWNFSKETMKQFGLTYEDVKERNPSLSPQRIVNHVGMNK